MKDQSNGKNTDAELDASGQDNEHNNTHDETNFYS